MLNPGLTLHVDAFFTSPFDFSCFVALAEKKLEFNVVRALVREGQGFAAPYPDLALTARIPILEHGDFWLSESQAVVEYLEETFPPPSWPGIYPEDIRLRARARQVMSFIRGDIGALVQERKSDMIFYPMAAPPLGPEAAATARELVAFASRVVERDDFAPWSIAHADLTFALLRLGRTGYELPGPILRFIEATSARPSVRAFLDHPRPPVAPR